MEQKICQNTSPSELLDIFPEAIPAIKENLKDLKRKYRKAEETGKEFVDTILMTTVGNKLMETALLRGFYYGPLKRMQRKIKLMENYLRINDWKKIPETERGEIGPEQIARAKQFPLENLISVNQMGFAKCPFHNEKNASLKVFKNNTWHCFGCNAGTDPIDFVMKKENIDFISAIKRLI